MIFDWGNDKIITEKNWDGKEIYPYSGQWASILAQSWTIFSPPRGGWKTPHLLSLFLIWYPGIFMASFIFSVKYEQQFQACKINDWDTRSKSHRACPANKWSHPPNSKWQLLFNRSCTHTITRIRLFDWEVCLIVPDSKRLGRLFENQRLAIWRGLIFSFSSFWKQFPMSDGKLCRCEWDPEGLNQFAGCLYQTCRVIGHISWRMISNKPVR
jgi:hypothetical protein